MSLTKEQILNAEDRILKEVQVPEWGGSVFVRTLDVREQVAYEEECSASEGSEHMTTVALSFWVVNEKGERLFSVDEAKALHAKSSLAVARVFRAGLDINRPMADKAVEAERKNS